MMKFVRKYILGYVGDGSALRERLKTVPSLMPFDRLGLLTAGLTVFTVLIVYRLFALQILDFHFYEVLASDEHQFQQVLQAHRGEIFMPDQSLGGQEFAVATNKQFFQVYAVPKQIKDAKQVAEQLQPLLNKNEEDLLASLSKPEDPYESLERKVSAERFAAIKSLQIAGVYGVPETYRYYIEENLGSNLLGFVGVKKDQPHGFYGVEGYFDDILAGKSGFFKTESDVAGRWIALSDKEIQEAQNGADIVLTMDRTVEYEVCKKLDEAMRIYGAKGGSVVVIEPFTGKIMAMCSAPDFNPNYYSKVADPADYNNRAIFGTYEPGSVFKPLVMAGAVDLDIVQPESTFVDTGSEKIDKFTIKNALDKVYGEQTMTQVLENSINTGMIFVQRKMGHDAFVDYVHRFGFGEKTGIELETESGGNLGSIDKNKSEIFTATASFGQGITVTPLQLAVAYAAIANGGNLLKPYVVDQIRYADGRVERRTPTTIRRVISTRTALLLTGMLSSVVKRGHGLKAKVPGYYVAGKTGTAQIANDKGGGYLEGVTNHTFVGYAPADNPRFVMVVKLDQPSTAVYAESTATPLFGEIAEFMLNYYGVQPDPSYDQ